MLALLHGVTVHCRLVKEKPSYDGGGVAGGNLTIIREGIMAISPAWGDDRHLIGEGQRPSPERKVACKKV